MQDELDGLYKQLGVLTSSSLPLPLHRSCGHAPVCWQGLESSFPTEDTNRSAISRPWVGSGYDELRVLVLGINQNNWGGLDALEQLARGAQDRFAAGHKWAHSGMRFYRIGCYAAAFSEAAGLTRPVWGSDGQPSLAHAAQALNMTAFTNQIKCSPSLNRGRPSEAMWLRCGLHILKREIGILQPRQVLILGKTDNTYHFEREVLGGSFTQFQSFGLLSTYIGSLDGLQFAVHVVPHPSARGGQDRAIIDDLRRLLTNREED